MSKVEFHIPISPTPQFLLMTHYLAASIDMNSGLRPSEYRIVVTVGAEGYRDLGALCPWAAAYPIEWRWVEEGLFRKFRYYATGNRRLSWPHRCGTVMLLDADLLVVGSLRDLAVAASTSGAVHGLAAYYSPFREHLSYRSHVDWWKETFHRAGLQEPAFQMEHSGWNIIHKELSGNAELRFSPVYLNYGVVAAAPEIVALLSRNIYDDIALAGEILDTPYKAQIALGLAIHRHAISWWPLPVGYNFPNIPEFFANLPESANDVRVFHYNQPFEIDKVRDFASYGHVENMLERTGMSPVNQKLAACFREVHYRRVVPDLERAGIPVQRPASDHFALERRRDAARRLVDAGELVEALDVLRTLAGEMPCDAHVQYLTGFVMHSLGKDPEEAAARYANALALGFDEFWVRYNLGSLQLQSNHREAGIANLQRARALNPAHPGFSVLLGD